MAARSPWSRLVLWSAACACAQFALALLDEAVKQFASQCGWSAGFHLLLLVAYGLLLAAWVRCLLLLWRLRHTRRDPKDQGCAEENRTTTDITDHTDKESDADSPESRL